jgi:hypothetical protein
VQHTTINHQTCYTIIMEINFTSSTVQGCSNGSIYHYILEPSVVKETLHDDTEINQVLLRKKFRERRNLMFEFLKECTSMHINARCKIMMIPKPNLGSYLPMCLKGKKLNECNCITDNDIIVMPSGQDHTGINPYQILYLQESIYQSNCFCEIIVDDNMFSKVKLIVHARQNNDVQSLLEEKVDELEDIISQITQKHTNTNETQFTNVDDNTKKEVDYSFCQSVNNEESLQRLETRVDFMEAIMLQVSAQFANLSEMMTIRDTQATI